MLIADRPFGLPERRQGATGLHGWQALGKTGDCSVPERRKDSGASTPVAGMPLSVLQFSASRFPRNHAAMTINCVEVCAAQLAEAPETRTTGPYVPYLG
jgi:hypothetical protein